MKSLMQLLRSKIAVIPVALVVVGLVMVGCSDTSQQPGQSTDTGQTPTITLASPSPDITSSSATPPTVALTGRINATVLDSFTRGPINGALVSINVGGQNISATTSSAGLVSLGGIPLDESQATTQPQPIQIIITGATGYPSPSFWATTLQRSGSETTNSNIASEIIIELHAANGVITGSLLDPVDGSLLSGVTVTYTPNPINVEISGATFIRVDQPFAGRAVTSTANGFTFTNVPSDHDYVIDISDPQGRIRNLRIGTPFSQAAPLAAQGALGTGVEVPPGGTVNLDAGATLGTGAAVLGGGLSANLVATPTQGRPGGDVVTPFVTAVTVGGTRVSQGQDLLANVVTALASTTSPTANINIALNERMDPGAGLAGIQLIDIGPKGTNAITGTRVLAAVTFDPTTTPVPNRNLLIKPATTLVAGRRYVVAGLGGLMDTAGNRYGGDQTAPPGGGGFAVCAGAGYPQCDRAGIPDYITGGIADLNGDGGLGTIAAERGIFFFTTNNDPDIVGSSAQVLALAGAPRVTGRRNNLVRLARAAGTTAGFGSRSAASFNVDWSGTTTVGGATVPLAPTGASAYNVCVVPDSTSGRTEDCVVLPSAPGVPSFSFGGPPTVPHSTGTPATSFRFSMDQLQAALAAVGRSLPLLTTEAALLAAPNTILDNNLRIQIRVTVFNRDGSEGPQSANAADATTSTLVDLGDNTTPSLNEDLNFDGTDAASEDVDGDAVIFADAAVKNYFSGAGIVFPASVTLPATPPFLAVYDVLVSAFPGTSAATTFANRVPLNNVAGARLNRTGTLRVTFNEDIAPASVTTTSIAIASGTRPIGGTATTATSLVTSVSVGDVDRDVTTGTNGNVVSVGVDNVFGLNTGDTLNVSVTDEAANRFTQNLILVDTIRPFAFTVVVADNGCNADTVSIFASEALNAASVTDARTLYTVAGVGITGASRAVLRPTDPASAQVAFTAPSVITLSYPDGTLFGITSGSTFTTTPVAPGVGGVTDLAENRNVFLNDGAVLIVGPPAVTSAFVVNDTISPRLTATVADFAASSWKVGAGAPPAAPAVPAAVSLAVVVRFTEPVDINTALNSTNYVFTSVDADTYGAITAVTGIACAPAVAGAVCGATVTFNFTSVAAGNGVTAGDRLTVSNVMDLSGNIIAVSNALTILLIPTPPAAPPTTYNVTCP